MPNQPPAPDTMIACLTREYDSSILAAALVARLRADGRAEGAAAVAAALNDHGIIIAGPPNPHRPDS